MAHTAKMGGLDETIETQTTGRLQNLNVTPMTANDFALKLYSH